MGDIHLRKLCSGSAGIKGNDRADKLTGKTTIKSGLSLRRSELLRSLRHYPQAQSQGYHTIDRKQERGVERGSARRASLKRPERAIVGQTSTGTVSKATLGKRSCLKGRERAIVNQTNTGLLNGNFGETSERRGGAYNYGLFRAHKYRLEPN